MKKKTYALAAAVLLIFAAGCAAPVVAAVTEGDIIGEWELESVKLNGVTYVDADHLDRFDYAFSFTEDGKATVRALGVTYTTDYEVREGWIVFADAALTAMRLKISGDRLEMDVNLTGGGLVFVRASDGA